MPWRGCSRHDIPDRRHGVWDWEPGAAGRSGRMGRRRDRRALEMRRRMKLTFREIGGYAGLIRGAELDTESLPAPAAKALESLITPDRPHRPHGSRSSSARDFISYEISVETKEGTQGILLDDTAVG